MKILSVVGARPNFMKIAPFARAIQQHISQSGIKIDHLIVHTGQHYDDRMSETFFRQLEIPEADINLGVGSGSHAEQVGQTMIEFEKVVRAEKPDWVVVMGDVNATLACSLTAKKEQIKCCHIEAGLRSGDMLMPEEINRIVTDRISDLLLTPDRISLQNLINEGISENRIKFVGNIMIDTLELYRSKAKKLDLNTIIEQNIINISSKPQTRGLEKGFIAITLHRPSNVDSDKTLSYIVRFILDEVAKNTLVMWSVHPRTRKALEQNGLWYEIMASPNLILFEPVGYLEMLKLNMDAKMFITDSGGLQEECTVLGTPCLTLRSNTERPVTLLENGGMSVLTGNDISLIRREFYNAMERSRMPVRPELWDGHTAERCLGAILDYSIPG